MAPDLKAAENALDVFEKKYGAKYSGAVECLTKDCDALLAFYSFPAEHWDHVRTTNPIESVFATVRHRTVRVKGALSQDTAKLSSSSPAILNLHERIENKLFLDRTRKDSNFKRPHICATLFQIEKCWLITAASRTWRKLKGENQLPKVIQGVKFRDGIE